MRTSNPNKMLFLSGSLLLLTACSQEAKQVSEEKHSIDQQQIEQKQLIDQRANELKTDADQTKKVTDQSIENQKKMLDMDKQALAGC